MLLILAGVVLNTVLGNDGIIAKAQLAKEKTNSAQREEEENLRNLENEIGSLGISREGSTDYDILWDWETTDEEGNVTQNVTNSGTITLNKSIENYKFLVVFAKGFLNGSWSNQVSNVIIPKVTTNISEYSNTLYQWTNAGYTISYGFPTTNTLDIGLGSCHYWTNCTLTQVVGIK